MKVAVYDHDRSLSRLLDAVRELAIEGLIADGTLPQHFDLPFGVKVVEDEISRILSKLTKEITKEAVATYEVSR